MRRQFPSLALAVALLGGPAIAHAADGVPVFVPPPPRPLLLRQMPCPPGGCAPATSGPVTQFALGVRTVFLSFDGVTLTASNSEDDARNNTSGILSAVVAPPGQRTIAPFNPGELSSTGGLNRAQIISRVVEQMYQLHAPYDIEFVTARPTSGAYHMVVFGGTCSAIAGSNNCAGIALLDCGDVLPANIVFAFPPGLRVDDLVTTAAQEMSHAFGLNHTDDSSDVMFPVIQSQTPTSYGAGDIPETDPQNCGGRSFQDSDQLLLDTIGARGDDTLAPTVTITAPASGSAVPPGSRVTAEVIDSTGIASVEFLIDDTLIRTVTSAPFAFDIPDAHPGGMVMLGIRATDGMGNTGLAQQPVYIATGDEACCSSDDQCNGGLECTNGLCVTDNAITGEMGDECSGNDNCTVGQCATLDDDQRCSVPCADDNPCPLGFECRGDTACWPRDCDGGGLCSVGGAQGAGGAWALALAALAVVGSTVALRRRRRR